ncbi:MAG: hypothetical protein II838_06240 [Lachnospiraceae bacterium]|nr:hypothetical protein [Lachnospiraceae bacterium]
MNFILGFIYLVVTCAVFVSMTTLALRGTSKLDNNVYFVCQAMVALWCGSRILILLSSNSIQLSIGHLIGNFGICFVGVFWFYFAVAYTNTKIPKVVRYMPGALETVMYGIIATNHLHGLYYERMESDQLVHGPLFLVNVGMIYFWIASGALLLYLRLDKHIPLNDKKMNSKNIRIGRTLIVLSTLVPVVFNLIYLTGIVKAKLDITPLGFAFSTLLVMVGTVNYDFIDSRRELLLTQEQLMIEQERNRIAQQVHDTAGHTFTVIQSYMKLAEVSIEKDKTQNAYNYVKEARKITSKGLQELREDINQLKQGESNELVSQGIQYLSNQVKEIPIIVTILGRDSEKYSYLYKNVYATVRETITNTLRYAKASKMDIILRFQEDALEIIMGDDGVGCDCIVDNNGLRGIRERVEQVGGNVKFISSIGEGFLTRIRLPLNQDE